jgi:hypothetical protein
MLEFIVHCKMSQILLLKYLKKKNELSESLIKENQGGG